LVAALLVVAALGVWVFGWLVLGAWQGVLALAPLLAVASGLVLLPVILVATTRRWRIVAAGACVVLVLPAVPLVLLVTHQSPLPADGIRLLEWNAQDYPDGAAVLEGLTADATPDLVVVSQVKQSALETSAALTARYPYRADTANPGSSDYVAVLSKYPITAEHTDVRPVPGPGPGLRALVVDISLPGGTVRIVTAHPTRPLLVPGQSYGAWRDPQLELLAEVVRSPDVAGGPPLLVTGDFNVTTREAAYARLVDATSLEDAVDGPRWAAVGTWRPTRRALPGVLTLDHVLHSSCLQPTGTKVLWHTGGSQHAPLVMTLRDAC
jgi:endonuclease/exonuclease/phosphatase (EEP) superfamily protein YafD